ncbi:MAG: ParB/RepB/Spo0J family partition protein [Duncaniella sp.]|nr:ParB/RepB/Spo0J family partition protein [Duncaniella sp.]
MATPKRPALGRGLDSLISMDDTPARGTSAISEIPIDHIHPNPDQPRRDFDNDSLADLARSVAEVGIIQPVSLRATGHDTYQIIAGERRYRAARMAGLSTIPAYIREATDTELTEMALIENIQREDLNAIEIALTFKKLIEQYSLTQERLSERIGKNRATIANFLRLLRLPAEVQLGLRDRVIDMGHARALLSLDDPALQLKIYELAVKEGLSVRKVEELVKKYRETPSEKPADDMHKPAFSAKDFDILRSHLSQRFGTRVGFSCDRAGKGKITFQFKNEAELERLITIFDTANSTPEA